MAAALAAFVVLREYWPLNPAPRQVDLQVYVGAVRWVWEGGALYDFEVTETGLPFTYPPFGLIAFAPTLWIPMSVMKTLSLLWAGASVLTLAYLTAHRSSVFRSGLLRRVPPRLAVPVLCILLGLSNLVLVGTRLGQISLLLVAVVAVDVLVVAERWPKLGGILTGIAAAVKLTPLAVLPMLWLAGRRRAAYTGTATFGLLTAGAAAIFPGATADYVLHKAGDLQRFGNPASVLNQSVNALLLRMGLPEGGLQRALFLIAALAILAVAWWRAAVLYRGGDEYGALVVTGAAMVAASPISWNHHLVWLWLAAFLTVARRWWWQVAWMGVLALITEFGVRSHLTSGVAPPLDWLSANLRAIAAVVVAVLVPVVTLRAWQLRSAWTSGARR